MKVQLYIGGRQADVQDDALILFNYQASDLTSPAVVRNSYTQAVTLPGTPANDAILGHYYRPDRVTPAGGYNARKRADFALYNEAGEVLESGYAKIDSIHTAPGGGHSYQVTLFGGLGGFLYGLTYRPDGTKRDLSDLEYPNLGDTLAINASAVSAAWNALNNGDTSGTPWGDINFVPCYNGLPDSKEFDADRAVYKPGNTAATQIAGVSTSASGYNPHPLAGGYILIEMTEKFTEWEMQEFRAYQQRPAVSLRALLLALADNTARGDGFTLSLDLSVMGSEYVNKTWMTLRVPDRQALVEGAGTLTKAQLFAGTATPADYLLALVKSLGLYLHYDAATRTITLMSRSAFFTGQVLDLTGRIAAEHDITPNTMDARRYEWASEMLGEWAEEYREKWGRQYGNHIVDTGYGFNEEIRPVMDGLAIKGAPEVLESSRGFMCLTGSVTGGAAINYRLKQAYAGTCVCTWRLYTQALQEVTLQAARTSIAGGLYTYSGADGSLADWAPRLQLHGADNKAIDGAGVLVFYAGIQSTPRRMNGTKVVYECPFRITDDVAAMDVLNNGRPCWDLSLIDGITTRTFPAFTRYYFFGGLLGYGLDWGDALETAHGRAQLPESGLYRHAWRAYIADRYNQDAKVVTAKVNLHGLQVGQDLFRSFYWFDGALWVLNRLANHSITTQDPTECEFIRVTNPEAYTAGQIL